MLEPDHSLGCDFAGDVVAIGSNASNKGVSSGDSVAGFVRGGYIARDNGAFQEYVVTRPEYVWRKPEYLPYEDAAPMGGVALSAAVHGLHHRLGLPFAFEPIPFPKPFLVWGGSTGVGMFSVKLASLAGYKVVTVASKHNWELLKSLGASKVFDWRDPDIVSHIKSWAVDEGGDFIKQGIDTISEKNSVETCAEIVGGGGKLITLLPIPRKTNPKGAYIQQMNVFDALKPKKTTYSRLMTEWNHNVIPKYLESGLLYKGMIPLKLYTGGLEELPEAIDYMRQGKASGHRVVVQLK